MEQVGRDILRNIYSFDPSQRPSNLGLSVEDLLYEIEDLGYNPLEFLSSKILEERNRIARQRELQRSRARKIYDLLIKLEEDSSWKLSCNPYGIYRNGVPVPDGTELTIRIDSEDRILEAPIRSIVKLLQPSRSIQIIPMNTMYHSFTEEIVVDLDYDQGIQLYQDLIEIDKQEHQGQINTVYDRTWENLLV